MSPLFINPLQVSLHGMDGLSRQRMIRYFDLCCNNAVHVVEAQLAQADIIDIDKASSRKLLKKKASLQAAKPIIAISIHEVENKIENVFYLKKPFEIEHMLHVVTEVKNSLEKKIETLDEMFEDTSLISNSHNNSSMTVDQFLIDWPENCRGLQENEPMSQLNIDYEVYEIPEYGKGNLPDWPLILPENKKEIENIAEIKNKKNQLTDKRNVRYLSYATRLKKRSKSDLDLMNINPVLTGYGEIDKMLEELQFVLENCEEKIETIKTDSDRKIVRYSFNSIKAKLIKKRFLFKNTKEAGKVLNISSKGALVRLKKPASFNAKISLKIYVDPLNIFDVSARVVRKEGEQLYGLLFSRYQHKLADYLIDSKSPSSIL